MPATGRPTLRFPTAAWGGPRDITLIQGLVRDPVTKDYFIAQARKVAGRDVQDTVIRRHSPDLSYLDRQEVRQGGHASSFGIEHDDGSRIWLGHDVEGPGRFAYTAGTTSFEPMTSLPRGTVSIHRDVVCIRNGDRFRGYSLSDAKKGRATELFEFTIPHWGKRFQGHSVVSHGLGAGLICVHRDVATKKESRAMAFTFAGELVRELDTTKMGDEAEGFLIEEKNDKVRVWVVKRTGGRNPKRVVVATLWIGDLPTSTTTVVTPPRDIAAVFKVFGVPKAVKTDSTIRAARGGYVSRYTYYVQGWLIALGYYNDVQDGSWGSETQAAYNNFRRNIRPAWPEEDCVGEPGLTSLALLRNAAVKATGQDQLPVVP